MPIDYKGKWSGLRQTVFYEFRSIDDPNVIVSTGTRLLGTTTINTGIDTIPTMTMTIPLEDLPTDELERLEQGVYIEPRLQRYNVVVYFQTEGSLKYRFNGTIDKLTIDYANYSVSMDLSHRVARMREWAMPINFSVKNVSVLDIVGPRYAALGYPNPPSNNADGSPNFSMQTYDQVVYFDGLFTTESSDVASTQDLMTKVTMTFGANNKLSALSELINNTEGLHFFVDLNAPNDRVIFISERSTYCANVIVSPYRYEKEECEETDDNFFVTMLTEPKFNVDYTNHFNRAIVFCGDIQDGVNHLTLEELNGTAPIEGFPVGMYEYELNTQPDTEWDENGKKINNEKIYKNFEILAYSKNGNREFYVEDTEQLKRDSNIVLNTTYNFNDLYPIPNLKQDIDEDGEMEELVITDGDRSQIISQAYQRAVRKLKAQRPQRAYQMNTSALPSWIWDGAKIHLLYSKTVNVPDEEECGDFKKRKIVNIDECLYLTKRTITFDSALNEVNTITLDSELRTKDVSATEIELREAAIEQGIGTTGVPHANLGSSTTKDTQYRTYLPGVPFVNIGKLGGPPD